ncbi:hypothetical protein PCASD_01189 [Puccinia coronata f. sp. avenae]|uniref:Uncharacterized protein n=1 Tax=Puccinia coronata f. sp. avenae TaxID=200324 RepID=A0A2N5VLT2_9BASI|nr:hypothetical protein PCASD_01189 [Puccinia coronata f. sp. avenae]
MSSTPTLLHSNHASTSACATRQSCIEALKNKSSALPFSDTPYWLQMTGLSPFIWLILPTRIPPAMRQTAQSVSQRIALPAEQIQCRCLRQLLLTKTRLPQTISSSFLLVTIRDYEKLIHPIDTSSPTNSQPELPSDGPGQGWLMS